MPPLDDAAKLTSIAAQLQDQPDEPQMVGAVLLRATEVVPEAQHVSLTVLQRRGFITLGATSSVAEQADQLQYGLEEGPCVEAASEVEWFRSGDVARDQRWPRWGPRAGELGVGSLLSVGLTARGSRVGALNMYAAETGLFEDRDVVELALLFSSHVAHALSSARLVAGLESAMGSRHIIGVAQGRLMQRFGLDLDQSFAVLQRISSTQNRKLRDIAGEIATTGDVEGLELGDGSG
jgi:GAF domain-containing protein